MISKTYKTEFCEHCGLDFTNRTYSEKIHHSNECSEFNANVKVYRFKSAKTPEEKLKWFFESIGMGGWQDVKDTSYEDVMEIYECLMGMFRKGIYNDETEKQEKYPKIVAYMESKRSEIKKEYNEIIEDEIKSVECEKNTTIENLKRCLVK